MNPRVLSIALRLSGMAAQFVCGFVVTLRCSSPQTAGFFAVTSAVPLAVLALGLELHTATDRLMARGLPVRVALAWLGRRQLPWALASGVVLFTVGPTTGVSLVLLVAVFGNGLVGLAVQEIFRALIMTGEQETANLIMVARNTLPFALVAMVALTGEFSVGLLGFAWAIGGLAGVAIGFVKLRKSRQWSAGDGVLRQGTARRHMGNFLPSTLSTRALLSGDILVLGAVIGHEHVGIYGNCNAVILAFYTLADVGVLQWRMRSLLGVEPGTQATGRFAREIGFLAGAASIGVLGTGLLLAMMTGAWTTESVLLAVVLAMSAGAIVFSLVPHVQVYGSGSDAYLRNSYLSAVAVFVAVAGLAAYEQSVILIAAAKLLAWLMAMLLLLGKLKSLKTVVRSEAKSA